MSISICSDAKTCSDDTRSASTTAGAGSPSPNKGPFVRRLFDRISPRYDLFNRISSLGLDRRWRRRTIAQLQLKPGMRVLDLASGTGDLARLAAEGLAPLGSVVGCDVSGQMLRFARKNLARAPAARWHVQRVQGRAEQLPFSSESFHAATIGFALRNVSDLPATFKELRRVIRPGGRVSLLEFGRPKFWPLKIGHRLWLSLAVPLIGVLTTGTLWPFLYLRRSILQFMPPEQVVHQMEEAGFVQVSAESLSHGIVYIYTAFRS